MKGKEMNNLVAQNLNVQIGNSEIHDILTKIGSAIDILTNGKYHAKEMGETLDRITDGVKIIIEGKNNLFRKW